MTDGAKVLVLVEGQTEEKFIKEVLAPSLSARRIWLIPTIIVTKRTGSSPAHKGGISTYAKLRTEIFVPHARGSIVGCDASRRWLASKAGRGSAMRRGRRASRRRSS